MDAFAWMRPAAPAEPATSPVAVVDPPATPAPAPTFVYNPWKLKELRRLYINLQDGSKVGYLDLATMAAVPESAETAAMLRRALAGLAPGFSAPAPSLQPQAEPEQVTEPQPLVMPWRDLSANRPGMLIENLDDASYRAGVAGEQRTAGVLAGLEREGYKWCTRFRCRRGRTLTTWSSARPGSTPSTPRPAPMPSRPKMALPTRMGTGRRGSSPCPGMPALPLSTFPGRRAWKWRSSRRWRHGHRGVHFGVMVSSS